jgi:hypothetical protein
MKTARTCYRWLMGMDLLLRLLGRPLVYSPNTPLTLAPNETFRCSQKGYSPRGEDLV